MASKTILICDKCKNESDELNNVVLGIKLNKDGRIPQISKEICNECLSEFGFENKSDEHYISNYVDVEHNIFSIIKKFFTKS